MSMYDRDDPRHQRYADHHRETMRRYDERRRAAAAAKDPSDA